jgi:SprT protein
MTAPASRESRNLKVLEKYLPEGTAPLIVSWIEAFRFKLKITRSRSSVYGNYCPPAGKKTHQITVNHDLNPFAFLITLVHEIAHLANWNKHGNSVAPHGKEWKEIFRALMQNFLNRDIFPEEIERNLVRYMKNPAASGCTDIALSGVPVEALKNGARFYYSKGREFEKIAQRRTRILCREVNSGREYLFYALTRVEISTESGF